ncbi:MAG: C-GCAxxG-C-C family protein, partial [Candidatus Lokiarchaeia archaeon]|nr:C-GCAxxG-C-C family protein [Candidatus Lokiarchaeia archaeon]
MEQEEIDKKFGEALKHYEEIFPKISPTEGGCAEATLTGILNILGIQDGLINNMMIPLSGGLGGYKSDKGQSAPCGAVIGGCAAVGVILGGKGREKMSSNLIPAAYMKSKQFAKEFEKEFGSVYCPILSGYDFSDQNAINEYVKDRTWGKKCYKYVLWAI